MLTTTSCENCVIKGRSQSPHRIAFLQEAKVRLSLHNIINDDNDDETLAVTKKDNFCVCTNSVSSSKSTYVFQTMFSRGTKTAVRQSYYVKLISSDDHIFGQLLPISPLDFK